VVLAGLLFVLRYQYRVAWLQPYEIGLDELFVAAVAGALLARGVARYGRVVLYRTVLLAFAVGIALVLGEYAARLQFRHAKSSGKAGDYFAHNVEGPAVRLNSLGFREREIPPKTAGRYRIAVVGDSFTWGQGIEEADRYSNLIEKFLGSGF